MKDTASEREKKRRFLCGNPFGGLFRFFKFNFGGCIFHAYQDIVKILTPSSSELQGLQFCFHNFFDPRPFKFRPLRKPPRRALGHHVSGPVGRTGGPKRKSFQGGTFDNGGFNICPTSKNVNTPFKGLRYIEQ